ncbi:hypothetical protein C8R44DRAFT_730778 [Mycena epipterygia]|nr:hypothetical protein C8R44DRAFT_730778 [Mycena epipterygia]
MCGTTTDLQPAPYSMDAHAGVPFQWWCNHSLKSKDRPDALTVKHGCIAGYFQKPLTDMVCVSRDKAMATLYWLCESGKASWYAVDKHGADGASGAVGLSWAVDGRCAFGQEGGYTHAGKYGHGMAEGNTGLEYEGSQRK